VRQENILFSDSHRKIVVFARSGRWTLGLIVFGSSGLAAIFLLLASSVVAGQSVTVTPSSLAFGNQTLSLRGAAKGGHAQAWN